MSDLSEKWKSIPLPVVDIDGHYVKPCSETKRLPSSHSRIKAENSKKALKEWAMSSSMHGVGKIAGDNQGFTIRKCIWLLLLLLSLGVFVCQIVMLTLKYFEYPTDVFRDEIVPNMNVMPSISICPLSVISLKKYRLHATEIDAKLALQNLSSSMFGIDLNNDYYHSVISNMTCEKRWENMPKNISNDNEAVRRGYVMALNALSDEELGRIAHNISEILIDCSYMGRQCSPSDFVRLRNPIFGFCYTINIDKKIISVGVGPIHSLSITLALNQSDYTNNFDYSAGYQLALHEAGKTPFPETLGYYLSPGQKTMVGITVSQYVNLVPPYGHCKNYTADENKAVNFVRYLKFPFTEKNKGETPVYSDTACFVSCVQKLALEHCGCLMPCTYFPYTMRGNATKVCELRLTKDKSDCYKEPFFKIANAECTPKCKAECAYKTYRPTFSTSQWPAQKFVDSLSSVMAASGYGNELNNKTKEERWQYMLNNLVSVGLYMDNLKVNYREVTAAYQLFDLLSDYGGQAGLWLGLSILTIFEIVELIARICSSICGRKNEKVSSLS